MGAGYVQFARSEKAHKDRKVERCDIRKVSPQEMGIRSRFAQQVFFCERLRSRGGSHSHIVVRGRIAGATWDLGEPTGVACHKYTTCI